MNDSLEIKLNSLAEESYRTFSCALLPGVDNILGVRIPLLRKIAKDIAKADTTNYLINAKNDTFEEVMIQGMVIGYMPCALNERFAYIQNFVPKIDNWSVCDSFCTTLKFTKKHKKETWKFLNPYFYSNKEYDVRFAAVMVLNYYVEEPYLKDIFSLFDAIKCEDYYAKMAISWAISCCFVKFAECTMEYLKNNTLDDFTYNKALQKIIESRKIDKSLKAKLRLMKRN